VVLKQTKAGKLADLNREEAYYSQVLRSHEEKIKIHETMLLTIKECIQSIVESFSGDLKKVLDEIIYKITDKYSNIVFDEENPVTSDQLIWALFGKSTEDVARMFRDGKNGEYTYLFKKKDAVKEKKKVE
jgi:hypothetical protein